MDKFKLNAGVHCRVPSNALADAENIYGGILGLDHVGPSAHYSMSSFKIGNHNMLMHQRKDPVCRTFEPELTT